MALAGLVAAHVFDWPPGDAAASIVIGIILGLVAAFMAIETKALLIGEAAAPEVVGEIDRLIAAEMGPGGPIRELGHLKSMHLGPDDVLVAASLAFKDSESAASVQATVDRLEAKIQARFPQVRHLYLEAQGGAGPVLTGATVDATPPAPPPRPPAPAAKGNYPPPKKAKGKKRRR